MAGEPAPQHLLDQAERARQRARGRRMPTSPAWPGMIQHPGERRASEAAYFDCIDNDEQEYVYAAGVAAVAAGPAPPEPEPPIGGGGCVPNTEDEAVQAAHMQLNAQRVAAFMSAARACADAAVEAEFANSRRAIETAARAARRKRHREAKAAEAAAAAD